MVVSPPSWGVCKELLGPRLAEMLEGGERAGQVPLQASLLPGWASRLGEKG